MAQPEGDETEARESNSLVRATRVVAERWLIIVLTAAVLVAVVLVIDLTTVKQYEASATLQVGSATTDVSKIVNPESSQGNDPAREVATALLLAQSEAVTARVRSDLKLREGLHAIDKKVVVSAEPDSDLIKITASDDDAIGAARLANAYGAAYVTLLTDASRNGVRTSMNVLQKQLDAVPATDTAQRSRLQSDIDRLSAFMAVETGDAELVDPARPPASPSSPQPVRDVILAILAGLAVGMAAAFIIDHFDRRVKSDIELEELTGLRSLVSVPESSFNPAGRQERQAALEPYRILRNGVARLVPGTPVRVVAISSAGYGHGRTSVAFGLARACALAGDRVVLVEADLRRPSFVDRFKLSADTGGLTTALEGEPVEGLLQPLLGGLELSILPAGPPSQSPSELLRGAPLDELLARLTALADIVIVDAPPLVGTADGGLLLSQSLVDACLIVARLRRIDQEDGRAIRAAVERHRLKTAGLVVCGSSEPGSNHA